MSDTNTSIRKKKRPLKRPFHGMSLSRLTSLSYFNERLLKQLVSQEKCSPVDDAVTEHGPTERRLGAND